MCWPSGWPAVPLIEDACTIEVKVARLHPLILEVNELTHIGCYVRDYQQRKEKNIE